MQSLKQEQLVALNDLAMTNAKALPFATLKMPREQKKQQPWER
jgi:hypothetical protein